MYKLKMFKMCDVQIRIKMHRAVLSCSILKGYSMYIKYVPKTSISIRISIAKTRNFILVPPEFNDL